MTRASVEGVSLSIEKYFLFSRADIHGYFFTYTLRKTEMEKVQISTTLIKRQVQDLVVFTSVIATKADNLEVIEEIENEFKEKGFIIVTPEQAASFAEYSEGA